MSEEVLLSRLFRPRSVAIIGASRNARKVGSLVLQNLISSDFQGQLYPINPEANEILGKRAYSSIDLVPSIVDLAIITLPPEEVLDQIRKCSRKSVSYALILSAGFSDENRNDLQEELRIAAKQSGIRIVGPNTTGLVNTENGLVATLEPMPRMMKGNVALIGQTGMFAGFLLSKILSTGIFGVSKVVGLGNKCDLNECHFLEHFLHDDKTKVIACYLEGFEIGKLRKIAMKFSLVKPLIALRCDATSLGFATMKYHSGSNTGDRDEFAAMCRRSGIIRANDFSELLDLAHAFSILPLPKSNRVAIVSNTGGGFVLAADNLSRNNLRMARFSEETIEKVKKLSPPWHRIGNPLDLAPIYFKSGIEIAYETAIEAVLKDKKVDSVLVIIGAVSQPVPSKLSLFTLGANLTKPVVLVTMGNIDCLKEIRQAAKNIPVCDEIVRAVKILGALYSYRTWLNNRQNENLKRKVDSRH